MPIEFSDNLLSVNSSRKFETVDVAERLGFLSAENIIVDNYPYRPFKVFNASILLNGDNLEIYARGVFDYYKYVSSILKVEIPLNDVLSKRSSHRAKLKGDLIIFPSRMEDFWGSEDPRAFILNGDKYIAYTGRTRWYYKESFEDDNKIETLTVIAKQIGGEWEKIGYLSFKTHIFEELKSIKNCVIAENKNVYSLCRIHTKGGKFYTTISEIKDSYWRDKGFKAILGVNTKVVITSAPFERKNGWGAPPIKVGNREFLAILHGVDKEMLVYRVFAVLLEENDALEIVAVTPHYVMEPKTVQEIYGDRPFVIFPCGSQIVDDDLLISYGASDSFVGISKMDLSELLSELDKNRVK